MEFSTFRASPSTARLMSLEVVFASDFNCVSALHGGLKSDETNSVVLKGTEFTRRQKLSNAHMKGRD